MTSPIALTEVGEPAFYRVDADARTTAHLRFDLRDAGLEVRLVRGRKMRTVEGLFDEFASALQFPFYFGENWAAFDECLADLEDFPVTGGVVIIMLEADQVLVDEHVDRLDVFVDVAKTAHATYSAPIERDEWWDRPAVPFHIVLQQQPSHDTRWLAAGATITPLTGVQPVPEPTMEDDELF